MTMATNILTMNYNKFDRYNGNLFFEHSRLQGIVRRFLYLKSDFYIHFALDFMDMYANLICIMGEIIFIVIQSMKLYGQPFDILETIVST